MKAAQFKILDDLFIYFFISEENFIKDSLSVPQLWCAAGVNLSGGRMVSSSDLTKQIKGSQSSLDQLDQENKVRSSCTHKTMFKLEISVQHFFFLFCFISIGLIWKTGERGEGTDGTGWDVQPCVGLHEHQLLN